MSNLAVVKSDAADAPQLHVVFRVADTEYAIAADTVLQMESFSGATRVPGAKPFVAGIIQIRGRVVPVLDLRVRFGLPPARATLDSRVVVGQVADRAVALLVDMAREVIKISKAQMKPPPRLLDDGTDGFVEAIAQVGSRMLMVLDFAKVIGEEPLDVVQR